MGQRAPLWRPLLMGAIGYAVWLGRQTPARLEARSWGVYPILAGVVAGCAVAAWGVQRARGRRWPWYAEMFAMLGLLADVAWALNVLLPLVRP